MGVKQDGYIDNKFSWQIAKKFIQAHSQENILFFTDYHELERQLKIQFSVKGIWRFAVLNLITKKILLYDEQNNLLEDDDQKFDAIFLGESIEVDNCAGWLAEFAYSKLKYNGYVIGQGNYSLAINRLCNLFNGYWYDPKNKNRSCFTEQEINQIFLVNKFAKVECLPIRRKMSQQEVRLVRNIKSKLDIDNIDFSLEKIIFIAVRDDHDKLLGQFKREVVFCLQRLDNDIQIADSLDSLAVAFNGEVVSNGEFIQIINNMTIDSFKVKNIVAKKAAELGYMELALMLLMNAYQQNPQNEDTVYFLALLLIQVKEIATARKILQNSHSMRSDITQLLATIKI